MTCEIVEAYPQFLEWIINNNFTTHSTVGEAKMAAEKELNSKIHVVDFFHLIAHTRSSFVCDGNYKVYNDRI